MEHIDSPRTSSSGDMTDTSPTSTQVPLSPSATSLTDSYEHLSPSEARSHLDASSPGAPSPSSGAYDRKARLLYCKSHVAIHPTNFSRDNVHGYLGIVETESKGNDVDAEGNSKGHGRKEILVTWVPDEVLQRMDVKDREGYKRVDERTQAAVPDEEDGFVFVSIPPPKGEKYAFSVPVSSIYSILVYPPSLSHWYGSATFNLTGGVSLPTLYFHDDESPLLAQSPTVGQTPSPRSQWGFPPFINLLSAHSSMLQSRLVTPRQNHGAELWLVNPSKSDREVHEAGYEEPVPLQSSSARSTSAPPAKSAASTVSPPSAPPRTGRRPSASVGLFGAAIVMPNYPPEPQFPSSPLGGTGASPKQSLLMGLSNITNLARKAAKEVLNAPIAQPVVPHLPPAMRSLVNAQGEWATSTSGANASGTQRGARGKGRKASEVASEFESARLYLARWARVVAEEGERARRQEIAASAGKGSGSGTGGSGDEDESTGLGVFSLLSSPNTGKPLPSTTRRPHQPITARDWDSLAAQGRDELYVRQEIFRRGFSSSVEPEEKRARREGWEVLLGIVPWKTGGLGGGEAGKLRRVQERRAALEAKRSEYEKLKKGWMDKVAVANLRRRSQPQLASVVNGNDRGGVNQGPQGSSSSAALTEGWKEEWHRIDVDCRRTDRNQPIYAVPAAAKDAGDEEKEGGGVPSGMEFGVGHEEEEGSSAALNPHIAALRMILMTYHTYAPELGYVQGMSDLLSPIYVVFDANEADAFWGLVGVMQMMESNFLRDQSGMKRQLSTLQRLIGVMDPELYAHLDRTGSLNLFFVFRWILISFKREFAFDQVIRLWEVLWTNFYSDQFNLFIALAILQSHRDVLIRYLKEFDEVLKYANDLSGTIDLDTTLAQAEVLFLSFRSIVQDLDESTATSKTKDGEDDTFGLRKRRGSAPDASHVDPAEGHGKDKQRENIDLLRDLVKGWRESEADDVESLEKQFQGTQL